jgi:predicted protein tyrosine phosphatase
VSEADILWADTVCVMEDKHAAQLKASFRELLQGKPLHVLDIPDDYRYMDPELVELVRSGVAGILENIASLKKDSG